MLRDFQYDYTKTTDYNPFDESIVVSQSLLGQYFLCEGRVGYASDPRYRDTPGEKTLFGTVAHGIVELTLTQPNTIVTVELIEELLRKALKKDGVTQKELGLKKADKQDFAAELLLWTQQYRTSLMPILQKDVVAMEQRRYLPLGYTEKGTPIVLAGTPDLILKNGSGHTIKDLKTTSSRKWSHSTAQFSKQPDVYLALARNEWDAKGFEFLVWRRDKQEWLFLFTDREEKDINQTLQQAYVLGCKIETGLFIPNPVDYMSWNNKRIWACSPKWCGAWDFCDFKDIHDDKNVNEESTISWA